MFTKDSRTENFLVQMGVDFKHTHKVGFEDLTSGWEGVNLARPVPVREDAVIEYASLMEGGSAAPAPILVAESGKYSVLDGVQRLSAAKLVGTTSLSAYVVTCDSDDVLAAIRVLANARLQGRAEPAEWTRRRAVEVLVVERGLSADEVARMGGWKVADITRIATSLKWGTRITDAGGPSFPDSMVEVVSQGLTTRDLAVSAEPIVDFLNIIKLAKFSASDATPHIDEFFKTITKSSKRTQTYTDRLERFREEPEVAVRLHGRRGPGLSRDVNLRRTLKTAITVIDEIIHSGEEILNVDEFFQLLGTIDFKLKSVSRNPKAVEVAVPADKWSTHAPN